MIEHCVIEREANRALRTGRCPGPAGACRSGPRPVPHILPVATAEHELDLARRHRAGAGIQVPFVRGSGRASIAADEAPEEGLAALEAVEKLEHRRGLSGLRMWVEGAPLIGTAI